MGHTYIGEDTPPIGSYEQNILWGHRLKATPNRVRVLEIFLMENRPKLISTESIVKDAKISMASVYRITELFVKNGIIRKIRLGQDHCFYEYALGKTHYHHAICVECGLVEEVAVCNKRDIEVSAQVGLKKFAMITNHSLEFSGICRECDKKLDLQS